MLRVILLFIALLAFGNAARAHADGEVNKCAVEAERNDLDLAIDHCTAAIQLTEISDQELAAAFNQRGFAYYKKKDYDRAIEDYDQAIRLGLADADCFYRRGLAYFEKNDYDRAIEGFDEALKRNPSHGPALIRRAKAYEAKRRYEQALADYEAATQADPKFNAERDKGFLFFYLGRMTQSAEMFETYTKSNPDDTWVILFRYLAEAKIGNALAAARDLEVDAANLKERRWPAPIIDFHLGRIDEKAMFAAANNPDPKMKNEMTCAANFHAGESRLFRAQVSAAIPLLRAAEKGCPSNFYESHGASTELKRLGEN
jgi:lipoprotein NlpI